MSKTSPATISPLFVTELYRADLAAQSGFEDFLAELDDTCRAIADEDEAGQTWSQQKGYLGYTSYASIGDLPAQASLFDDLRKLLDGTSLSLPTSLTTTSKGTS